MSDYSTFTTAGLQPSNTAESPTTIVCPALITVTLGNVIVTTSIPSVTTSTSQYSDNPYLSAGAGAIGVGEGCRVGRAQSHLSSPLQPSGASVESSSKQNIGSPLVHPGPGQHPEVANTSPMPQVDWHNPRPLSSSGHAIREMEAAGHRGPDLAMHQEVHGEGSGVVKHQDAGRIPSDEGLLRDIPPAHNSIMQ